MGKFACFWEVMYVIKEQMAIMIERILQQHFDFFKVAEVEQHTSNAYHHLSTQKSRIVSNNFILVSGFSGLFSKVSLLQ